MPIILRKPLAADATYILRLEETCMRAYAEALWGSWEQSDTVDTLDLEGRFIIARDDINVGCVQEKWHPHHLFLEELYIDPPFQRQGIGAAVLAMKTNEAASKHLPTRLSVLVTNPAEAFYRREGFVIVSETRERRLMLKAATASGGADPC